MRGAWIMNVRSTPTPLAMRRTVICRLRPPPRMRMTVPSNTWIRSRLPSTTLTETRTVSPGAISGRSERSCSRSSSLMAFMSGIDLVATGDARRWWCDTRTRPRTAAATGGSIPASLGDRQGASGAVVVLAPELVEDGLVRVAERRGLQEVRPPFKRSAQRLPPAPALHLAVIARPQDRGNLHPAECLRSSVLRVLEESGRERVPFVRGLLNDTGQEPNDRVDEDEGRQLTAGEHVVADAHLAIREAPCPLVNALVPSADEGEVRVAGEIARHRIGQSFAGRIHQDHGCALRPERLDGRKERLGSHDHSRSPAVRVVVHRPMAAETVLPEIVETERHGAEVLGATDDRRPQGDLEQLGEERDDIDSHRHQRTSSASSAAMTITPRSRSMRSTTLRSAGTSRSPDG